MQKLMDMVTAKLVTEGVVKACDKEWFAYGLEKRILTIFTAIPFLIIAIALSDIWTAVMYLCSFYFLRVRTNGYHAKTIVSCIAWSLILELCFVLWFLPKLNTIGSICVVNVVAAIVVFAFAPVNNSNIHFDEAELQAGRVKARQRMVLLFAFAIVLYMLSFISAVKGITLGNSMATLLLVIGKIKEGVFTDENTERAQDKN